MQAADPRADVTICSCIQDGVSQVIIYVLQKAPSSMKYDNILHFSWSNELRIIEHKADLEIRLSITVQNVGKTAIPFTIIKLNPPLI